MKVSMKMKVFLVFIAVVLSISWGVSQVDASSDKVHKWVLQSAAPAGTPHMDTLFAFAENIKRMSGGRLLIEVLPAGAVVGPFEQMEAVNRGILDAGAWWPHYATGEHPAAGLFSLPAGGGFGMDQNILIAWFIWGGGQDLYDQLVQKEMGYDLKMFFVEPVGPEPLGWFKEPIRDMEHFRKTRFRAPPGLPGEIYSKLGVPVISMAGPDIVPSAERGVLDGCEWSAPVIDMTMGFQDVFPYYALNGLHQNTTITDLYINGKKWRALPKELQAIVQTATESAMLRSLTFYWNKNQDAINQMTAKGVTLIDSPKGYEEAYIAKTKEVLAEYSARNAFFKKVLDSQREFAQKTVPYYYRNLTTYTGVAAAGSDF